MIKTSCGSRNGTSSWQKQHCGECFYRSFSQRRLPAGCFPFYSPQLLLVRRQQFHGLHTFSGVFLCLPHIHRERFIDDCEIQNPSDGPTWLSHDEDAEFVQFHFDSDLGHKCDVSRQQRKRESFGARLWHEKEQVILAFSSKYSFHPVVAESKDSLFEANQSAIVFDLCREKHFDKALDVLFCMSPAPPPTVYVYFLNECRKNTVPMNVKKVYAYFDHHNSSFVELITDFLVLKVSNSGNTLNEESASLSLPWLTVFAWSAMISALVEQGLVTEALKMMQRMQEDGAEPSSYIFVSLIKACSSIKDLFHGMKLHAIVVMKGFESHLIVGSTLISMYGNCGAILEAESSFRILCFHDLVSCNAMLAAFVDVLQGDRALLLYRQMHVEGMHANHGTFVIALQACRCLAELEEGIVSGNESLRPMSLEIGQALHSAIRREGLTSDTFIGNTLVNMYGNAGSVVDAELVFDTISDRDIISWNAMLSMYVKNNEGQKALWHYRLLLEEGVDPVPLTCVFALQACDIIADDEQAIVLGGNSVKSRALKLGQALHLDACIMGFTSNVFLGTALISLYGRCGAVLELEDVFLSLREWDTVSWNAVLSAYIEQGHGERALRFFQQMQEDGVGSNSQTLVFALQACSMLAETEETVVLNGRSVKAIALKIGKCVHGLALRKRLLNSFVCNTSVSMYGTCGAISEAEHVFTALSQPDVVSWNAIFSAYVEQGQGVPVLQLFVEMQKKGTTPNNLTCMFALQACILISENERPVLVEGTLKKAVSFDIGIALHKDAFAKGFLLDAFVVNSLLVMYGRCGDALEMDNLFNSILHKTIVSWNAMLSMCVEQDRPEQALRLYKSSKEEQIIPDDATLISVLQACGMTGCLLLCEEVHFNVVSAGCDQNPLMAATLLNAYGGCGRIGDMKAFFVELVECDLAIWNAFIAGHLGEEGIASTVRVYEEMKQSGIDPDVLTFTSIVSACSHFGLVGDGFEYFEYISQHYRIAPNLRNYGAVIDLFGRAGDFKKVQILLKRMPFKPDLSIALCLLGAGRAHGSLELAEWAFYHAVNLQPKEPTAYVMMSNIYADSRP